MNYMPDNITDCIEEISMALEKGLLILGDLTMEYSFDGDSSKYIKPWRHEVSRITTYMNIVFDYVAEASEMIVRARELKGGTAND